jgi:hypothetical protein
MGKIIFDSLPYLDREYEEMKDVVDALIQQSLSTTSTKGLSTESAAILSRFKAADLFFTSKSTSDLLSSEMARIERGEKLNCIDLDRYKVSPTLSTASADANGVGGKKRNQSNHNGGDGNDANNGKLEDLACVQSEYLKNSLMNAELMKEFGEAAWTFRNHYVQTAIDELDASLDATKKEIAQVNKKRKLLQVQISHFS